MRHKVQPIAIQHPLKGGRHLVGKRTHRLRNGLLIGLGVVVLVAGAGAWVGFRALEARDSLEHAQSMVGELKALAAARDIEGIQKLASTLSDDTARAAELTSDPVWRLAEAIPVLGKNLTVVRELADVVNTVAEDALSPVMDATAGGLDAFKPQDGRFDIAFYTRLAARVANAGEVLHEQAARLEDLDTVGTEGVVSSAADKLKGLVDQALPLVDEGAKVVAKLPIALGGSGPRNYIMLFQNSAESMSLGGNTAAWVVLNVTDGVLTITSQPNSEDFARDQPIPITLDPALLDLYNPDYFRYATNLMLRPDFPSDATLASAFWWRFSGVTVDGVVALDPIALSYMLTATGPLTLPSGVVMSADNAVPLLLSDVYTMYADPADQNAFFAQAASSVFTVLTSASPDTTALIDGILKAVTEDRLMLWSAHPDEQAIIEQTQLVGVLAKDNIKKTEIGVFFVENSASKMSYYLRTNLTLSTTVCQPELAPAYRAVVTLHSDISPDAYAALSDYVRSGVYGDPVKTRTLVFVYGPPGGSFAGWTWSSTSLGAELVTTGFDLGRPVAQIGVDLAPGESAAIQADFAVPAGEYGPLDARVTPMVQPTAVTLESPGCV